MQRFIHACPCCKTDIVLELYDARKETKDCLVFYLAPNCKAELEQYKRTSFSQPIDFPKNIICQMPKSHFQLPKAKARADLCSDLMLFYIEQGC